MKIKTSILLLCLCTMTSFLFSLENDEEALKFVNLDLNGEYVFSKNFIGKSWVILDFFETDCKPCKKELPQLEGLLEEFGERGLKAILFAADLEGPSLIKPYFRENPTTLTVLLDHYKVTTEKYGISVIPTVFLVNPEGMVVVKEEGYSEESIMEMRGILNEAL